MHIYWNSVAEFVETGPRLVAEDDTHVIVAFAVSKAVLARHMPFIGALADVATQRED
jgi:hypothetical protein